MRSFRSFAAAAVLAAFVTPALAATLIDDSLNRNWGNWATHDTAAASGGGGGVYSETGGKLVITGTGANDNMTNAYEHGPNPTVTTNLTVSGTPSAGDWVGVGTHWTGVGTEGNHIQNRLTFDGTNWLLEIWTRRIADGYQPRATSAAIAPASLPAGTIQLISTRAGDNLTLTLLDAPGGAQLAQAAFVMTSDDQRAEFGQVHVRSSRVSATTAFNLEVLTIAEAAGVAYTDDFENNNLFPDWFAETAIPGASGMAHYNFDPSKVGGARADLSAYPGALAIRGADDLRYSRVVSRYTTNAAATGLPFGHFGNIDARALVTFPNTAPAQGYFELGMRNVGNESTRVKAAVVPMAVPPRVVLYTGNYNTFTVQNSANLTGYTYTPGDKLILTVTSNGNAFTASVALSTAPGVALGTASATITTNAAGQIVLAAGEVGDNSPVSPAAAFTAVVEHFQVVDHGDTFPAFPAVTAVQDWSLY